MNKPTAAQEHVRDHASLALLLIAPAGCGKTEALAIRVAALLRTERITAPQKILLATFTNRSKDNLRERLRHYVTTRSHRDRVSVTNFHGLASRIIRAHGSVIGIDPQIELPDNDWISERCFELGLNWGGRDVVVDIFQELKQQALTDDQVTAALMAKGNQWAQQIEQERLAGNRASYDDLLRYAELILAHDAVAALYRNHFGAVIVDEYQDLTPQQLRVLQRIGSGRITFAGDLAQGIYSFAGARPVQMHRLIESLCDDAIEFNESHRSSPAVLKMVNAVNAHTGGATLTSADPIGWPGGGIAGRSLFEHASDEAQWVTKCARAILARAPGHRVAVMSRIKSRLRFIDGKLSEHNIEVHRWDDGLLDTDTARIVRATLSRLKLIDLEAAQNKIAFLRGIARLNEVHEPDTRQALCTALAWVLERVGDGLSPAEIVERIQIGDQKTLLTAPGVHLLSGHVGKGQQFDWVIIVGAEDGNMPFFKAGSADEMLEEIRVFGVMLSRARHGVVVTASNNVPTLNGADKNRDLSPFWSMLDVANPLDHSALVQTLTSAPWNELSRR